MSTPSYFSNLPDLTYSVSINKAGQTKDIVIKDYFRLLRIREDVKRLNTLYVDYVVEDGERPDQIAFKEYGEEQFYWMILQANDIVDYNGQWPLSFNALDAFILEKYGGREAAEQAHHYETVEEYNSQGLLMIPGGMYVDKDWSTDYWYDDNTRRTTFPVMINNYEFESRLNTKKSHIQIIDKKYIYDVDRDLRNFYKKLKASKSEVDISDALKTSVHGREK